MNNILLQLKLGQTNERWVDILNSNFAVLDYFKTTSGDVDSAITAAVNLHNEKANAHESLFDNKVDKVEGKALSDENFTEAFKNKLTDIEAEAEVNIIEQVRQNGVALIVNPDNRSVDVRVPVMVDTINEETAAQGQAQYTTPYAVRNFVNQKVSVTFSYKGASLFEELPVTGQIPGDTYNILNNFNYGGKDYPAGTNVVWVAGDPIGKWDPMSGAVDLSHLQEKEDAALSTSSKNVVGSINEIWTLVHDLDLATSSYKGLMSAPDKAKLDTLFYDDDFSSSGAGLIRNDKLTQALESKVDVAAVGAPDGVASLESTGTIPENQMPLSILSNVAASYPVTQTDAEWGNQTVTNITWLKTGIPGKRPVAAYRTIWRFNYQGTVVDYTDLADLSEAAEVRDTWLVQTTDEYYRWNGLTWVNVGTELPTGQEAIDGYESVVAHFAFTGTTISMTVDNKFDGILITV